MARIAKIAIDCQKSPKLKSKRDPFSTLSPPCIQSDKKEEYAHSYCPPVRCCHARCHSACLLRNRFRSGWPAAGLGPLSVSYSAGRTPDAGRLHCGGKGRRALPEHGRFYSSCGADLRGGGFLGAGNEPPD